MKDLSKRQTDIIGAALEIISRTGITGLNIKTLSDRIGVTEGAIYRHFDSKAEILSTVAELFESSTTEILQSILSSDGTSVERIKRFFLGRCEQFSENRGLVMVMFSEEIFKKEKKIQKKVLSTIENHRKLLVETIKEGQKRREIIDSVRAEHLFLMIIGSLRLLVTKWRSRNFNFDLSAKGNELWGSIERVITTNCKEA